MPDRSRLPSFAGQATRLWPALALALAVALFVAVVPSRSPSTVTAAGGPAVGAVNGGPTAGGVDASTGAATDGSAAAAGGAGAAAGGTAAGTAAGATGRPGLNRPGCTPPAGLYVVTDPKSPCAPPGLDCSRNKVANGTTCRPPAYTGPKPKAGVQGVSADKITIVYYQPKQNAQVQAILSAAGTATDADRQAALAAVGGWIQKNFELYGRTLDLKYVQGTSATSDAAGQQADAVMVATQYKPLFVMTGYAGDTFYDELHRRGITAFTWYQYAESYFKSHAPNLFGLFQDRDTTLNYEAEYICKRLVGPGRVASHAGDPILASKQRVFGIIAQDNYGNDKYLSDQLKSRCGVKVGAVVTYPADISQAVQIATNAVAQMKAAGVTSVTCVCDVIAPIYLTEQATNQGWFPEWIQNGFYVTDANAAARLYDQTQWGHSFGTSTLAFPALLAETPGYRVCIAGGGPAHSCRQGQAAVYAPLALLANAFEVLGPDGITTQNIASLFMSFPPLGGTKPNEPTLSLGPQGAGPYTLLDDVMEIWYDPKRNGPDGKSGAAFLVQSGRRYHVGALPTTDPNVFVDDGSPQPPPDPDANS